MKSPRSPDDILRRVKRLARVDGWSVAIFAGLCTVGSLAFLDPVGISVGLLVTLGGALEVHGYRMLRRNDGRGMRWLARSQLVILGTIWAYGLERLLSFDAGYLQTEVIPNARAMLTAHGINLDDYLAQVGEDAADIVPLVRLFFVVLYGSVLLVTLIYQGGLYLYYRGRTAAVQEALKSPPLIPAPAPAAPPPDRPTSDYAI
jgi:hypothetical protein